jgi:hypothetical protein
MASAKRVKLHYSLCESAIPENLGAAHAGEFWIARDQNSVWFVASDGTVVSLSDFLLNAKPVAPPRHGKDGKDGISPPPAHDGRAGLRGPAGHDGISIKGDKGDRGEPGRPGRDAEPCVCFDATQRMGRIEARLDMLESLCARVANNSVSTSQATVEILQRSISDANASVESLKRTNVQFADSRSVSELASIVKLLRGRLYAQQQTIDGLMAANRKGSEYIAWLQERQKARAVKN